MSKLPYPEAAQDLVNKLVPLRDYCASEKGRLDPGDPKHKFRFQHVQQIEAALESSRELYEAVNVEMERRNQVTAVLSGSTRAILAAQRILDKTDYLLNYTPEQRADLSDHAQAFALYSHPRLTFPASNASQSI